MPNPKRRPPPAIIDNLETIGDRRRGDASARDVGRFFPDSKPVDGASDDYSASLRFLLSYDGSKETFNAYRRDVERLLQWAWRIEQRSVRSLTREDIVEFIAFANDPPKTWIGSRNVPRFRVVDGERQPNPEWRPYVASVSKAVFRGGKAPDASAYSPSQASIRATFKVLSSFYDYLVQESYVAANPVTLIRQKSKFLRREHNEAYVRRLSDLQWDYVLETAEIMAAEDPDKHERTLFIMTALFAMYLRISELVADQRSAPVMGDFRKDRDGNWWFHVTGKGNKRRTVTVSDAMLQALKRYRRSMEMDELPTPNEDAPLLPKLRGKGPMTDARGLRRIVQACFDRAHLRMLSDGMDKADAAEIREATVHWLRHTGISEDVQHRPREHVRDDAGHSSMATTDRYIESNRRERHATGRGKPARFFEET